MMLNSVPIIRNEVIVFKKKFNNELILRTIYSLDRRNFTLNSIAKEYFELCDGNINCIGIINEMKDKYPNIPEKVLEKDLRIVLLEFAKRGIIDWKNGKGAFDDEMKNERNGCVYKISDYNEAKHVLSNCETFPVIYISPYYDKEILGNRVLLETYMLYKNMFVFKLFKEEMVCQILCESSYIDFSIQIVCMSYDDSKVTNEELQSFFEWIIDQIISISKPNAVEKKYLFVYVSLDCEEYKFLDFFTKHGVLKREIKNSSDVACYTYVY